MFSFDFVFWQSLHLSALLQTMWEQVSGFIGFFVEVIFFRPHYSCVCLNWKSDASSLPWFSINNDLPSCPGQVFLHLRPCWMGSNYGRDISRWIISRQKSGRVEIEIGMAIPTFLTNRDQVGQPDLSQNSGCVGMPYPEFSSIFTGLFRSKKLGKVGESRGKLGKSWLTLKILKDRDGHLDLSRRVGMSRGG